MVVPLTKVIIGTGLGEDLKRGMISSFVDIECV
jgi:hypothetical protein